MPVTKDQAQMLASLAVAVRPHGARRWDTAGVMANIAKVAERDLGNVAMAVLRAAADGKVLSPGVIPTSGPHWNERLTEGTAVIASKGPWCASCGQARPAAVHRDGTCQWTEKPPKADPDRKAELLEAARADMAANPGPAVVERIAEPVACIDGCVRGGGHTGPHQTNPQPPPEDERQAGDERGE